MNILLHLLPQNVAGLTFLVTANMLRKMTQWFALSLPRISVLFSNKDQFSQYSFEFNKPHLSFPLLHFLYRWYHFLENLRGTYKVMKSPGLLSVALIKCNDQKHPGKKRVYFNLQVAVHHQGKSGQELKQRPQRNRACSACFLLPLWTRGSATHTGLSHINH